MRFTRKKLVLLALAGLLGVGIPSAQAQTTLRYKFKEGDKLDYVMEQKMVMKMSVLGKDIQTGVDQVIDISQNVTGVDKDGKAKMTQKFERWRMTMDTPMGKVEIDSKDKEEPNNPIAKLIAPMIKAMAGSEFSMTMDPRGEMSNIKVPEAFLKAIKANPLPGMDDMFSEDGFKRLMSQNGLVLPKEAMSKGKNWDTKMDMKSPFGTMKTTNTYTYDGPGKGDRKDLEQIGFKTQLSLEPDPKAPIEVKMKVEDAKGTAYFDNQAGRLAELNAVQIMNMEINAGGQTINSRIETTITMKLKKKE